MNIEYKINVPVSTDQFIELLRAPTSGDRRPIEDRECMDGMVKNSNLIISAWEGEKLTGIARNIQYTVILLAAVFMLPACNQQGSSNRLFEFSGHTMGTTWDVKVVGLSKTTSQSAVHDAINEILSTISRSMSTYDAESELSRFNKTASTEWVAASPSLVEVLDTANEISKLTQGAFDVTVGPLVNLWGFGPELTSGEVPNQSEIESARVRVGYSRLEVRRTPAAIRKHLSGLYIDLSSIAKGYAVDRIAEYLEQQGIENYLVEIGGELRGKGHNERDTAWRIGIERPSTTDRAVYTTIEINQTGLATSGDYRNYFEQDGQRYSHTINPQTGWPVTHKLASVTVIAPSAMRADALATALMVMGPVDGYEFAKREGIAALFIVKAGDKFTDRTSPTFVKRQADHKG